MFLSLHEPRSKETIERHKTRQPITSTILLWLMAKQHLSSVYFPSACACKPFILQIKHSAKIYLIISGYIGHSASTTSNRSPTFLSVVKRRNAISSSKRMKQRDIISRCENLLLWGGSKKKKSSGMKIIKRRLI